MFSSSIGHSRQAPPVRPSPSLEGLEQVVPPARSRLDLQLNKPLPAKPLPDPPERISTTWSDDTSTIESFGTPTPRESKDSSESYPVFVSSGSEDLVDLVDQPSEEPIPTLSHPLVSSPDEELPVDLNERSFLSDEQHGRPTHWTQNQLGPNHYFREKKFDFFPELATPSALTRPVSGIDPKKRKKETGLLSLPSFDFGRNRPRLNSAECGGLALAHEVRDSIRSCVHRTISKKKSFESSKRPFRPATAPSDFPYEDDISSPPKTPALTFSDRSDSGSSGLKHIDVNICEWMRTMSVSTASSLNGRCETPRTPRTPRTPTSPRSVHVQRQKQLAIPLSSYQKHGAASWEKPASKKMSRQGHNVRFPRYGGHKRAPSSKKACRHSYAYSRATSPSPRLRSQLHQNTRHYVRALQHGTNQMLGALEGAKKKMAGSKMDRKRAQLKSNIRLIGPVNPCTTHGRVDLWI